jgi:hypothetical protein
VERRAERAGTLFFQFFSKVAWRAHKYEPSTGPTVDAWRVGSGQADCQRAFAATSGMAALQMRTILSPLSAITVTSSSPWRS